MFPERRVFLKSDDDTQYLRLRPSTQALIFSTISLVIAWSVVATAILLMDSIGSGNFREQSLRDQQTYQARLSQMAQERDIRIDEAANAQERFSLALDQVSQIQSELLAVDMRRIELKQALDAVQDKLRDKVAEKEALEDQIASLNIQTQSGETEGAQVSPASEQTVALDYLTNALRETARERDEIAKLADEALKRAEDIELEMQLVEERNNQIFRQIEEAMVVSLSPLEKMFRAAGVNPDSILNTVRQGYSGFGGPLMNMSTRGDEHADHNHSRAVGILENLDELNVYRIAAEKLPFAEPLRGSFRYTSGYGRRWGRMHYGTDFAAAHGTPIYSTADGVVVHAGWGSGYGKLIKIKHDFGIETRYAHLSKIRVKVGQRVSRGQRIGDMGNTGRSTGTHLHYEVRVNGKPINPMNYIKAGRDVF